MALLDEAIDNQRAQYPGGIELVRRGGRGRHGHSGPPPLQQTLEIPQIAAGEGYVAGPPESAAAPRESQMGDLPRLLYDLMYNPSIRLMGGKSGPHVAQVLSNIIPIIAALAVARYGIGHTDRPFDPKEFGIPEINEIGPQGPIYRIPPRAPSPRQQAPGRTIPLGPGRTTGELEFEPFLHPWEEEEEPPGGGWKH